jgi:hypothetical protein
MNNLVVASLTPPVTGNDLMSLVSVLDMIERARVRLLY